MFHDVDKETEPIWSNIDIFDVLFVSADYWLMETFEQKKALKWKTTRKYFNSNSSVKIGGGYERFRSGQKLFINNAQLAAVRALN